MIGLLQNPYELALFLRREEQRRLPVDRGGVQMQTLPSPEARVQLCPLITPNQVRTIERLAAAILRLLSF